MSSERSMDRPRMIAVMLAGVGVVLQLVGMSWDALMHAVDPGLAAREGIFTLGNPSHALIIGGLAITAAAIARMFALVALSADSSRAWRGLALGGIAVLALSAGSATTLGLVTGGGPAGHAHGARGGHHGSGVDPMAKDPTFLSLQEILKKQGTEKALQRLEELAATDPKILGVAHALAHALGRYSFSHYRRVEEAFRRCRETFESGCYHGVLEGYFDSLREVTRADVATVCDRAADKTAGSLLRYQCVHGLGHGLAGHFHGAMPEALSLCDALPSSRDRSSCHTGVFMENIVVAWHVRYGDPSTHAHGDFKVALRDDDLHYPCNAVAARYQAACYEMQTSAMLVVTGHDFERTFRACDAAPAPYITHCYLSLGRDVAGVTLRDQTKSLELCSRGNAKHRGHCFAGVAKNLFGLAWQVEPAAAFCHKTPADAKTLCYQAIGDQVAGLPGDATARERACATVEAGFVQVCRRAARLG